MEGKSGIHPQVLACLISQLSTKTGDLLATSVEIPQNQFELCQFNKEFEIAVSSPYGATQMKDLKVMKPHIQNILFDAFFMYMGFCVASFRAFLLCMIEQQRMRMVISVGLCCITI